MHVPAAARPCHGHLDAFDKFGLILKVALLPYHRLGGASWNPDFYNEVGLDDLADQSPDSFKRTRRPHIYVVSQVVSHVTQNQSGFFYCLHFA